MFGSKLLSEAKLFGERRSRNFCHPALNIEKLDPFQMVRMPMKEKDNYSVWKLYSII